MMNRVWNKYAGLNNYYNTNYLKSGQAIVVTSSKSIHKKGK